MAVRAILVQIVVLLSIQVSSASIDPLPRCPSEWQLHEKNLARSCQTADEESSPPLNQRGSFHECPENTKELFTCDAEFVKGVLLGPFRSKPGEWTSVNLPLGDLLKRGDKIVSYTGDAMSPSGEPIPYPPLHMHHLHVIHGGVDHMFETHGDYTMTKQGYVRHLPNDSCYVFDGVTNENKLHIEAQINDVRYTHGSSMSNVGTTWTSPSLSSNETAIPPTPQLNVEVEWYLRIVFGLTKQPCQAVDKIIGWWPFTEDSMKDMFGRYDAGNTPRLLWWRYRMPSDGTMLLPSYLHSHRGRYGGFLLVAGKHSPASLAGINGSPRDSMQGSCNNIDCARSQLMCAAKERLICYDNQSSPTFIKLPSKNDGTGGYYDRFGQIICQLHEFQKNDVFTLFWFSTPQWANESEHFAQHSMFFNYFVPRGTTPRAFSTSWRIGSNAYGVWDFESNSYNGFFEAKLLIDRDAEHNETLSQMYSAMEEDSDTSMGPSTSTSTHACIPLVDENDHANDNDNDSAAANHNNNHKNNDTGDGKANDNANHNADDNDNNGTTVSTFNSDDALTKHTTTDTTPQPSVDTPIISVDDNDTDINSNTDNDTSSDDTSSNEVSSNDSSSNNTSSNDTASSEDTTTPHNKGVIHKNPAMMVGGDASFSATKTHAIIVIGVVCMFAIVIVVRKARAKTVY